MYMHTDVCRNELWYTSRLTKCMWNFGSTISSEIQLKPFKPRQWKRKESGKITATRFCNQLLGCATCFVLHVPSWWGFSASWQSSTRDRRAHLLMCPVRLCVDSPKGLQAQERHFINHKMIYFNPFHQTQMCLVQRTVMRTVCRAC